MLVETTDIKEIPGASIMPTLSLQYTILQQDVHES